MLYIYIYIVIVSYMLPFLHGPAPLPYPSIADSPNLGVERPESDPTLARFNDSAAVAYDWNDTLLALDSERLLGANEVLLYR